MEGDNMFRRCYIAVVLITLFGTQNCTLVAAEPEYKETIEFFVDFSEMKCSVSVLFTFFGASFPLSPWEFADEPSFLAIRASTECTRYGNYTEIMVELNSSGIASEAQGRLVADALASKLEDFSGLSIPLNRSLDRFDRVAYYYRSEFPATDKFGDVFLRQEMGGFGDILAPPLLNENVRMSFQLIELGDSYVWMASVTLHPADFEVVSGEEYIISLKEMTGYTGLILPTPKASSSILRLIVDQNSAGYVLIPLGSVPDMAMTQQTPRLVTFHRGIAGTSVDDLSLRFKIVPSTTISPTIIVLAIVFSLAAALLVTELIIRKKRREVWRGPFKHY